jgi:hypothetical protein
MTTNAAKTALRMMIRVMCLLSQRCTHRVGRDPKRGVASPSESPKSGRL